MRKAFITNILIRKSLVYVPTRKQGFFYTPSVFGLKNPPIAHLCDFRKPQNRP